MRVGGISSPAVINASGSARRATAADRDRPESGSAETSRAVIALPPIERSQPAMRWTGRPAAEFLAHLIATDQQAPQTRVRRRAPPAEAARVYAAASAAPPHAAGARLTRVA